MGFVDMHLQHLFFLHKYLGDLIKGYALITLNTTNEISRQMPISFKEIPTEV